MIIALPTLLNSLVYAGIGMLVFVAGFVLLDLLTPGKLWEEIRDKQNVAVAQFAGAIAIPWVSS